MGETVMTATASFDGWYRQEHPRVLALLTVASGDAELASEVTAEAFTRALERWDRVAAMDSPAAWAYRVAVNLMRRRLRRAAVEQRLWSRAVEPRRARISGGHVMTEPAEALRTLLDHPPSTPPPVEDLQQRVDIRRRRRTRRRIALAGLATILGAVAIVPLLDDPSDRSTQVVAGPAPTTTTTVGTEPAGTRLEFQVPEGWTTLFAVADRMVVATRPLSESDRALAMLARDDVAFTAFPADGVVIVMGGDPVQAKYGFDLAKNAPIDPGPTYALGPEKTLTGGVRTRRGDVPSSGVRIASYAGPSAPPARMREAEAIATGLRMVKTGDPSVRPPPPPPGSRPGLPNGALPVPEAGLPEVARVATSGSTLLLVAGRDCAYVRWVDAQPSLPGYQSLAGACGVRPAGTAIEELGGAAHLIRGPGAPASTAVIFRAGPQVRSVTVRLVDGRSVPAALTADGWGLAAADGRIVALTGIDTAGRPVPEVLVQ